MIFIFSLILYDESNKLKVEEVRRILRNKEIFFSLISRKTEKFWSIQIIVSGVSELTETYGKVVVLEDDLELSPEFHLYGSCFGNHQNDPEIMQVGATR